MACKSLDPKQAIECLKEKYPQYNFDKAVYTKSAAKITVTCPKHGDFEVSYNNMKTKNRGCPKCNGGIKFDTNSAIEKLKEFFPNYDFSKFVYNGQNKDCTIICPNGHEVTKKFHSFAIGNGCAICKDTNLKTEAHKVRKADYKSVEEYVKELEEKYTTIDWTNAYNVNRKKDKVEVTCLIHGSFGVILENVKNLKHPCPFCSNEIKQNKAITEEYLKEREETINSRKEREDEFINTVIFENPEFTIDKSINSGLRNYEDIIVECKTHGQFRYPVEYAKRFKNKIICPKCNGGYSMEFYIYNNLRNKYKDLAFSHKDRTIIQSKHAGYNLEIDILIKELNLGIEYNEIGCHSENSNAYNAGVFNNIREYEEYKVNEAKAKGIDLIFVREKDITKYGLNSVLSKLYYTIDERIKNKQ